MTGLERTAEWPVPNVSAAVIGVDGVRDSVGDVDRRFRLASVAKMISSWAVLVAVEEGIVGLDQPVGQPGCTLRHLLAHAGGYAFDGEEPITRPGSRRIYSNTGIELAAGAVVEAAGLPFSAYLAEAVLGPLEMTATELRGSPAHGMWSSVRDLSRFAGELLRPTLLAPTRPKVVEYQGMPA